MESQRIKQYKLPDAPGVYFFKHGRKVLYVGKATSLRDRVRSYFNGDIAEARGPRIEKMIREVTSLTWKETDSVLEALILEAKYIKKLSPTYNAREKDNKSFYYVIMTREQFPRVFLVRERDLVTKYDPEDILYTFGPFPHSSELKEALKIIRKIFPYRDTCEPNTGKPCFNRQIGLCPGVCAGEITGREYKKIITHLKLFFEGRKARLILKLTKEMKNASRKKEFEKAAKLRNQIFALNHIRDVAIIKTRKKENEEKQVRIEAYDIAHISGTDTVGVMTVILDGEPEKGAYRKFKLKGDTATKANDTANLKEVLKRRLSHSEWRFPDVIVVDGSTAQINAASEVLEKAGLFVPVLGVVKDERHRPKEIKGNKKLSFDYETEILLANKEAHRFALAYHRKRRDTML